MVAAIQSIFSDNGTVLQVVPCGETSINLIATQADGTSTSAFLAVDQAATLVGAIVDGLDKWGSVA